MNPSTTTWQYLAPNPKSCYKQLFVKGTRIRAHVLYGMFVSAEEPMTPEQIASEFKLPAEAVNEAIGYCQSNPPEIGQDFEREERLMETSGINDREYKYGGPAHSGLPHETVPALPTSNTSLCATRLST